MARVKIEDLPKDIKITGNEIRRINGGVMEYSAVFKGKIYPKVEVERNYHEMLYDEQPLYDV